MTSPDERPFLELEESLLMRELRRNPEQLDHLLSDDFIEIGSDGRSYDKVAILVALAEESELKRDLKDFTARTLAPDIVLTNYRVDRSDGRSSRRSSVWRREAGAWRMAFHQGTIIA